MQHMGVVLRGSCSSSKLWCVGVGVRGGYSLRRLLCVGVSVKESRCVGVALSGSCNICE